MGRVTVALVAESPSFTREVVDSVNPCLLVSAILGTAAARDALTRLYDDPSVPIDLRRVRCLARSLLRYFEVSLERVTRSLIEDAIQEFWVRLFQKKPGAFDPARGEARTFLWLVMRDAARAVLEFEAVPHNRRGKMAVSKFQVAQVSAVADREPQNGDDVGEVVALSDDIVESESAMAVRDLLASMSPSLGRVLANIARDDLTLSDASAFTGISRFTARRMTDAWAREHQHLLAS